MILVPADPDAVVGEVEVEEEPSAPAGVSPVVIIAVIAVAALAGAAVIFKKKEH
jgi:hypothetical protein